MELEALAAEQRREQQLFEQQREMERQRQEERRHLAAIKIQAVVKGHL